jgi:hypothetical protein
MQGGRDRKARRSLIRLQGSSSVMKACAVHRRFEAGLRYAVKDLLAFKDGRSRRVRFGGRYRSGLGRFG